MDFCIFVGRYWGGNCKRIFETTGVGFGRTELSIRLSCTECCALSSGHGPRGLGFQRAEEGVDFHVFRAGQQSTKKKNLNKTNKNNFP